MATELKFLFAPLEAVGHFNACIGIGQKLIERGHKVVFVTPNSFKGKLLPLGFEEEYFQCPAVDELDDCKFAKIIAEMAPALANSSVQKMETLNKALYGEAIKKTKESHIALTELFHRVNPNLVVLDTVAHAPALLDQGIPWIMSTSYSGLTTYASEELPPAFSGYSAKEGNKRLWKEYAKRHYEAMRPMIDNFEAWVLENGGPELKLTTSPFLLALSPFANICMYPKELSYEEYCPLSSNWHRFDAFVRHVDGTFEIPRQLQTFPGKLIYFSMGTIGSCEIVLMKRLLGFLANSPNRFIVSKGPLGDSLELAANMWGENNVPQTLVISAVDLVITHGGNNTVTESFYFGKPLLVLPLFADQLDNATRIAETDHGIQLQPYQTSEAELLTAIEQLLNNADLKNKMISVGKRMRSSNSQERAAQLVEAVAFNNLKIVC